LIDPNWITAVATAVGGVAGTIVAALAGLAFRQAMLDRKPTVESDEYWQNDGSLTIRLILRNTQAARRLALTDLATSREERQTYTSTAAMAAAAVEEQKANLERANVNLARTDIRSPVNGWVTNLLLRQGDYATTGQTALSLVDADSFWVDGYFEETALKSIHDGDPAKIWLLGYGEMLKGHVDSVARGIVVSNVTPSRSGLATVNPIFTWVRLAQRIPVRVQIDHIPPDIRLVIGLTATIEIEPKP
jgi:multidrug resistance efflux pump